MLGDWICHAMKSIIIVYVSKCGLVIFIRFVVWVNFMRREPQKKVARSLWWMDAEKHKSHWSIRRLLPPLAILVTYFLPLFCPFNGFHDNFITFIHIDTQPNWRCHAWYWTYHSQIIFIIHILQVHRQIQNGYKLNVYVIHICHPWHVNHFQLWWACHKSRKNTTSSFDVQIIFVSICFVSPKCQSGTTCSTGVVLGYSLGFGLVISIPNMVDYSG